MLIACGLFKGLVAGTWRDATNRAAVEPGVAAVRGGSHLPPAARFLCSIVKALHKGTY